MSIKQRNDMYKKKKILIITNSGIGIYSFRKELLEKLIQKGFEVLIAYDDGQRRREIRNIGCRCIHLPFESSNTNPMKDIVLFFRCLQIIYQEKPNIVLLYTIKPCIYGGMASFITKTPCIATVTGVSMALLTNNRIVSRVSTFLCQKGYSCSKVVFFQNRENESFFSKKKIAIGKHVMVQGSGVNLQEHHFVSYPPNDGTIKILYLGRFLKVKGLEEFAYAIKKAKIDKPNIICKIVGEKCEELPLLEQVIKDGMIEKHPHTDDVGPYLEWCDALVMPSYMEGMSNVLQEAAATGRPTLASNVSGCKEIVDDGVTGLLFTAKDKEDIYRKLIAFASLPYEERVQMGIKARKKMETEFDRKLVTDKYISIIQKFI